MVNTTRHGTSAGEKGGLGHKLYNLTARSTGGTKKAAKENLARYEAGQDSNKFFKYLVGASVVIGVMVGLVLAPIPTLSVIGGAVGLGLVAAGVVATVSYLRKHNSVEKETPKVALKKNCEIDPRVNLSAMNYEANVTKLNTNSHQVKNLEEKSLKNVKHSENVKPNITRF